MSNVMTRVLAASLLLAGVACPAWAQSYSVPSCGEGSFLAFRNAKFDCLVPGIPRTNLDAAWQACNDHTHQLSPVISFMPGFERCDAVLSLMIKDRPFPPPYEPRVTRKSDIERDIATVQRGLDDPNGSAK